MKIAVTGSTGLIGRALVSRLRAARHQVVPVVRTSAGPDEIGWDIHAGTIDHAGLEGLDAVVHLAGAGIGDKRWSASRKAEIYTSRIDGTTLLAEALAALDRPPSVLLSGSAVGIYGDRGDEVLDESSTRGQGFLADLVADWEAATAPCQANGIHVVHLRSGVVLSADGGALKKQLPLFRFALGGRLGSGRQWLPWISVDDEVGAIVWLLTNDMAGAVNLVAPEPVTNAEFTDTLGGVLRRPTVLPIPSFGPRLLLGRELAENLLFTSQRIVPSRLLDAGYEFLHPSLDTALRAVLDRSAELA